MSPMPCEMPSGIWTENFGFILDAGREAGALNRTIPLVANDFTSRVPPICRFGLTDRSYARCREIQASFGILVSRSNIPAIRMETERFPDTSSLR